VNTRVKRMALPVGGAVAASALLGASLATTAEAAPLYTNKPLASASEAYTIAHWWLAENGKALKQATEYRYDYKVSGAKLQIKGGPTADSKPGKTAPTGFGKVTATKTKNVNLPKTIGKVFFVKDGKPQWCSATSIDAKYKNLVLTAGHCVYDDKANGDVLDKWVFVPGYYQGKAPWGIYVGKQAFTHYDYAVYEDYDKDYAFVTVYNGIALDKVSEVSEETFNAYKGDKWTGEATITEEEYKKCKLATGWHKKSANCWVEVEATAEEVGPNYPGAQQTKVEVSYAQYKAAPGGLQRGGQWKKGQGYKFGYEVENVTKAQYDAYTGPGTKILTKKGDYLIVHYYVQKWVKPGKAKKYGRTVFYIAQWKDVGALGANVGGQGFAWNQKKGSTVFVFGYPAAEHPDGNKPFTGVTPKWCYGKTYTAVNSKVKAEESLGIKCSMTGGADGAPWLWQYSSAKRVGYAVGVTSWFGDADGNNRIDFSASPYFDGETADIYKVARNVWSGTIVTKAGEVTIPA